MKVAWLLVLVGCAPIGERHQHKPDASVTPRDAAVDAAVDAPSHPFRPDAAPDATIVQTFIVGVECSGGNCTGGYNGQKNTQGPPTADYLCTTHSFPHATSYTISGAQPGGKFCSYNATTKQFGCDSSCSGCNAIDSVTCSNP